MIETPHISKTNDQMTAMIRLTIPRSEIQEVMQPALIELMEVLQDQGLPAAGPWFTHHLRMDPEVFDFEVCIPVNAPIIPTRRVEQGLLPASRIARTIYHGPYEGLADAWPEFIDWIEEQNLTPAPDLIECYLTGPESSPNPEDWRTEFIRPLVG